MLTLVKVSIIGLAILMELCLLFGCESLSNTRYKVDTLYLSRPLVYTRERLMSSRSIEKEWLYKQFDKGNDDGFQGYQLFRTSQKLRAGGSVQFDPLGGAVDVRALSSIKGDQRIEDLNRQIMAVALQKRLEDLQNGKIKPEDILTSPPTDPARISVTSDYSFANHSSNSALVLPVPSGNEQNPVLLNNERLNDRKSYRDLLRTYIREQELDDSHDLNGLTLYNLEFALTIASAKENHHVGLVKIIIENGSGVSEKLYKSWVGFLNDQIMEEALTMQKKVSLGMLTDYEKADMLSNKAIILKKLKAYSKPIDYQTQLDILMKKDLSTLLTDNNRSEAELLAIKLYAMEYILSKKNAIMYEIVTVNQPEKRNYDKEIYFDVQLQSCKFKIFKNKLSALPNAPYVLSIDPKETAENISMKAVKEKLRDYFLKALMTVSNTGVKAGGDVEYEKRTLAEQSGILRVPILVGYANMDKEFGWLIGPRYHVNEKGRVEYEQRNKQHSVQASLVVPAWMEQLELTVQAGWLSDNGMFNINNSNKNNNNSTQGSDKDNKNSKMIVDLPGDLRALTDALLQKNGVSDKKPEIYIHAGYNKKLYEVRIGQKATLIIRGANLWRNYEVYIGTQKANNVYLLPDMGGLVASFDAIERPVNDFDKPSLADLTVVTSHGIAVAKSAVQIHPAEKDEKKSEVLKLATHSVNANGELGFEVPDSALFPRGYSALKIKVRKKGEPGWHDVVGKTEVTDKKLSCQLTLKKKPKWWKVTTEMEVDVLVVPRPQEKESSLLTKPVSCVFFPSSKEGKLTLPLKTLKVNTSKPSAEKIKVLVPFQQDNPHYQLFFKAYPGFDAAIKSKSGLSLVMMQKDKVIYTIPAVSVTRAPIEEIDFEVDTDFLAQYSKESGEFQLVLAYNDGNSTRMVPIENNLKIMALTAEKR